MSEAIAQGVSLSRTDALLAEITRKGSTRDSIASVYREGIRATLRRTPEDFVDWPTVNAALLKRFKPSGLDYIKAQAWKGV